MDAKLVKALLAISLLAAVAACGRKEGKSVRLGRLSASLSIDPDPPIASDNRLHVTLRDGGGRPVDGATLRLRYDMAAMGAMAEMKGEGETTAVGEGRYDISYTLPMNGKWTILVKVEAPGEPARQLQLFVSPPRQGFTLAPAAGDSRGERPGETGVGGGAMPGMGGPPAPPLRCLPDAGASCPAPTLSVSPGQQQLIDLGYGTVEQRPMTVTLHAAGHVLVDERALANVTLRYEAYAVKLFVAETGKNVRRGDPMVKVYSPDLLDAEQELLDVERGGRAQRAHGTMLVEAARRRLSYWDLSAEQIAELERRRAADGTVVVHAPITGTVLEREIVEGTHLTPGMVLYRLGNLGRTIWIEAEMYERDAPFIEVGEPASATLPALGGKPYEARVTFVEPTVDERTRTLRARLELANPSLVLKPGMYADVTIERPLGTRLAVPDSALILTGEHRYAFVARDEGRLAPVEVQVGAFAGGWDEVLSGLHAGDRVVTSAAFLVASEAQLEGIFARFSGPGSRP